jgi:hypothetical protein
MRIAAGVLELLIAIYLAVAIFVPSIRPFVGRGAKNMRVAGPAFCVIAAIAMFVWAGTTLLQPKA